MILHNYYGFKKEEVFNVDYFGIPIIDVPRGWLATSSHGLVMYFSVEPRRIVGEAEGSNFWDTVDGIGVRLNIATVDLDGRNWRETKVEVGNNGIKMHDDKPELMFSVERDDCIEYFFLSERARDIAIEGEVLHELSNYRYEYDIDIIREGELIAKVSKLKVS